MTVDRVTSVCFSFIRKIAWFESKVPLHYGEHENVLLSHVTLYVHLLLLWPKDDGLKSYFDFNSRGYRFDSGISNQAGFGQLDISSIGRALKIPLQTNSPEAKRYYKYKFSLYRDDGGKYGKV